MRQMLFISALMALLNSHITAQGALLPLGSLEETTLSRLEIKTGLPAPFHAGLKPYNRGAMASFAMQLDTLQNLSLADRADLRYVFLNNNEWLVGGDRFPGDSPRIQKALEDPRFEKSRRPVLRHFYATPANLFEVNTPDFHLRINPLIQFKYGAQRNSEQPYLLNQRGLELRAGIDDRIYVHMDVVDNQAQFPGYVREMFNRTQSLPGAGLVKNFNGFGAERGYGFLLSQGYVGFNLTRHVGAQFGYGRNFIGNGYRSMLLSDFSFNYLHLKLNWQVWKLHFQNIFGELNSSSANATPGSAIVPKKYFAAHHLSFNITPKFNIGLFEAVVFNRENQFELQYLNPVVLYRTVEHGLGSPDNVLIGLDAKWNFLDRFQLYGQFLLDEFFYKELIVERRGWWANKFSGQAGLKYIDAFGIDHLDLQAEYNAARPFTYTHFSEASAYTHYRQPLAHPLGANFREWVLTGRWQILPNLTAQGRVILAKTGEDSQNTNWGGNLLLSSNTRTLDFGNVTGQGIATDIRILGLDLSYRLAHNIFLDLEYFSRTKTSADLSRNRDESYIGGGIRMNMARWRQDF